MFKRTTNRLGGISLKFSAFHCLYCRCFLWFVRTRKGGQANSVSPSVVRFKYVALRGHNEVSVGQQHLALTALTN